MTRRAVITGTGSALPSRRVDNDELAKIVDTSDEWIRERSGICTRYFAGEGETTSSLQCTGSTCLSLWKIATVPGGGSPTGGMHVTGKLATFSRSDGAGTQVTYNGMPLYTYSGDSQAGQANGQGLQGVWFAVTPSMTATTTGSSKGGGYGGGGYGGGGYNP